MGSIEKERHASWLENFYDLIVAIIVFQLSSNLNRDVSISGFLGFIALFIPVLWSWMGVTFYNTRFETDDLGHRLLTLLQMAAAAFMAVCVPDGLGKNSTGFALSYAAIRAILVIEYLRTGRHVPATRPLVKRYSIGFSIAAGLWFVSALVPPPFRFVFWILGLVIDISTPTIFTRSMSIKFAPNIHHLPERFGSFTIIVLGISILAVVDGISSHKWTAQSITDAALGLGIAFSLWWIYFDSVDGAEIKALRSERRVGVYLSWLYIHFPLLIGFTALGVSIEHVVLSNQNLAMPFAEKWLLCISVSMCLFALGVMHITSEKTKPVRNISLTKAFPMPLYGIIAGTVVVIIAIPDEGLLPVFLMSAMAIACAGQVVLDIVRHPHHRLFKM
ncbi:MAG: low temperature requirement protein A [Candidatus Nitrosopolaris sp.]